MPISTPLAFLGAIDALLVGRVVFSIAMIVALYVMGAAIRGMVERRVQEPAARFGLIHVVNYVIVGFAILILGIIWLPSFGGLPVVIGLLAAAAAISAREIVTTVAGWLLITSGQAFSIGDRIEMSGIRGDVIGFGILRTTLMEVDGWVHGDQYTGRIVTVTNAAVFEQPLYNYTRYFPFIWDEIDVPVSFRSNWRKARDICLQVAEQLSEPILESARSQVGALTRQSFVSQTELSPSVYLTFNENWVVVAVRYLAPVRQRRLTKDQLSRDILTAIGQAPDISFGREALAPSSPVNVSERQDDAKPIDRREGGR